MPDVFNDANRELIIALAARSGEPAIYPRPVFAESGGLIAYGADGGPVPQAAEYIDRILKGANPGEATVRMRPTTRQPARWASSLSAAGTSSAYQFPKSLEFVARSMSNCVSIEW